MPFNHWPINHDNADVNMPAFLTAKNLKPFISKELEVTSSQKELRPWVRTFPTDFYKLRA